jgi:hypothetical protein
MPITNPQPKPSPMRVNSRRHQEVAYRMSTRNQSARVQPGPSFEDVRNTVRAAIYASDPLERAEAAADLTLWGLPVDPGAVIIAAERLTANALVR